MSTGLPVQFHVDDDGEAMGLVHWYCSEACRAKNPDPDHECGPVVDGVSPLFSDQLRCETCGTDLDTLPQEASR